MANPERGEVAFVVDGKTYTLKPSMNAMCEVEARTGKTFAELLEGVAKNRMTDAREVLWVLLQKAHAPEFPTVKSVGDLFDAAGGEGALIAALQRSVQVNAPPPGEVGRRPRKARAGIGGVSIGTPAGSA